MLHKKILLFLLYLLLISNNPSLLTAPKDFGVIPIATFEDAQEHFDNADKRSLFVFDIDQTLVIEKDPFLQLRTLLFATQRSLPQESSSRTSQFALKTFPSHNALTLLEKIYPQNSGIKKLLKLYPNHNSSELSTIYTLLKNCRLYNAVLYSIKRTLIEQRIAETIQRLKKKGAPVLALSAFTAGDYGYGNNECHRFLDLRALGIEFSDKHPSFNISEFKKHFREQPEIDFYKGIISSSTESKGEILNRFIQSMKAKPLHVVFFDDLVHNHANMLEGLASQTLSLYRYLYKGSQDFPREPVDQYVIREQVCYLNEHKDYTQKLLDDAKTYAEYSKEARVEFIRNLMKNPSLFLESSKAQKTVQWRDLLHAADNP